MRRFLSFILGGAVLTTVLAILEVVLAFGGQVIASIFSIFPWQWARDTASWFALTGQQLKYYPPASLIVEKVSAGQNVDFTTQMEKAPAFFDTSAKILTNPSTWITVGFSIFILVLVISVIRGHFIKNIGSVVDKGLERVSTWPKALATIAVILIILMVFRIAVFMGVQAVEAFVPLAFPAALVAVFVFFWAKIREGMLQLLTLVVFLIIAALLGGMTVPGMFDNGIEVTIPVDKIAQLSHTMWSAWGTYTRELFVWLLLIGVCLVGAGLAKSFPSRDPNSHRKGLFQ